MEQPKAAPFHALRRLFSIEQVAARSLATARPRVVSNGPFSLVVQKVLRVGFRLVVGSPTRVVSRLVVGSTTRA